MSDDVIIDQLKRVRGQLDGVLNMYQDDRTCIDVVRQVIAARNSLGRVARDLLTGEATRCAKESSPEQLNDVLKELFKYD